MNDEQSEGMEALNQSLNDHMEICDLKQKVKRLETKVKRLTKAGDGLFGIAYSAGPGEGRVQKLDAWQAAKGVQS